MSEVHLDAEFPPPMVETVIHNAAIQVNKLPMGPGEFMTLLRFHTPAMVYTIKLDEQAVRITADALLGKQGSPEIVIASPGDVPGLKA